MGEEMDSTMRASGDARHVVLAGASGTIGGAVARQLIADGHRVTCLMRQSKSSAPGAGAGELAQLAGAALAPVDFADARSVADAIKSASPETIVSCIASRSGAP
ncbi:MAG: NAD-dependent epimerase/dehydratase family protein, partial [Pseudomonadota bacterium]